MNPKAFLWDIDGTLIDTESLQFSAWKKALAPYHSLALEDYRPCVGAGGAENAARLCEMASIPEKADEINLARKAHYAKLRSKGIPSIRGNIQLLESCKQSGTTLAAVSSSELMHVHDNIRTLGLTKSFDHVFGLEGIRFAPKPAPDLYLHALHALSVVAWECIAFEDSANGVAAARTAGIFCVALPGEITTAQNLSAANLRLEPDEPRHLSSIIASYEKDLF